MSKVLVAGLNKLDANLVPIEAAPKPPPCDEMGDVDNDGYVTIDDATMVAEYVVGTRVFTDEQLRRADVDGDGIVDIADAMFIAQYVEGIIDTFPACVPPVEGFTYSNLFCDTERVGEDAYGGVAHLIYRATITNPGGVTQSRHVRLKFYSHEYNETYEGVDSFDLSLGPFESHDYDYQRDFEGPEWQIQDMRSGTVYDVWMEDDGGGKSEVISITAK